MRIVRGIIIVALTLIVGSQDYNGRGLQMLEQSFTEDVPPFAFLDTFIDLPMSFLAALGLIAVFVEGLTPL
ncbi:hypothetical protein [Gracilibacillus suaedae]|uniref:hypothetical protein n=1 Tax=Gracilibacillus suaedae TaxID=2820273 RepID=UPI001E343D6C|nr:hypothetical protein [Gracilibacillus suaedae]